MLQILYLDLTLTEKQLNWTIKTTFMKKASCASYKGIPFVVAPVLIAKIRTTVLFFYLLLF